MKILFFEWGSYLYHDIEDTMRKRGITVRTVSYRFRDFYNDDFFVSKFKKFMDEGYDAVFSVNFFPLVAKCCYERNVKYLSWSSDCPMQVPLGHESFGYPTNYIFYFDRTQLMAHEAMGYNNGFHLPLAVNMERLKKLKTGSEQFQKYAADVSMVGRLYDTDFDSFIAEMDDFRQGYIEGIVQSQMRLYGAYFLDSILTDNFAKDLTKYYENKGIKLSGDITADFLQTQTAKMITNRERVLMLKLLSNHYETKLYSNRIDERLDKVEFMGTAGYLEEMNHIFRASKVNLNITLKCITSGIPQRAIDIMGSGGFLLSNYQPELDEFFVNGEEMVMYGSIEEAYELCSYYLRNEEERMRISTAGRKKVSEQFTYDKQLEKIFSIIC